MRVLSFDIGLRNLATAVVTVKPGFSFSGVPEFQSYLTPTETADEYKLRALLYFLQHGWVLEQWELIDVSKVLDKDVKNVKRLGDVTKALALTDTLEALEQRWFADTAPDIVCVENQHNANAVMRGVCMGIIVFFRRSFPDTVMEGKSGSHKLKICDALGVKKGDGVPIKKRKTVTGSMAAFLSEEAACAPPPPPTPTWRPGGGKKRSFRISTGSKREAYEDNKNRADMAVKRLFPDGHSVLAANSKKTDDLCDVLLMSLWILWTRVAPRAPSSKRKPKNTSTKSYFHFVVSAVSA